MENWFKHDSNAHTNPKLKALKCKFGMAGIGMYWTIIEFLRKSKEYKLPAKSYIWSALAEEMLSTPESVQEFIKFCINDVELLTTDDMFFWSESLLKCMEKFNEIREKRIYAGKQRHVNKEDTAQGQQKLACAEHVLSKSQLLDKIRLDKNKKENIKEKFFDSNSPEFRIASTFWGEISKSNTAQKEPNLQEWAREIDKIHRIDKRDYHWIDRIFFAAIEDPFWEPNIRSPQKLRKQINCGRLDKFAPDEWMSDEEVFEKIKQSSTQRKESQENPNG